MFLLRLFDRADPAQPVAAHMLAEGTTSIGRDPASDWAIPDPECELSRQHLRLVCEDGVLALRPLGSNGVFHGETGARLPDNVDIPVALGDAVDFGRYRMVIDTAPFATQSGASFERTMVFAAPFGRNREVGTDWGDGEAEATAYDDTSLLEAFCDGAGLDVSALSGDEPADIMRKAGEIYRQMVLGLGDLVTARSSAKAELSMDRTTISAQDNNPFKWAPGRRLAIDLLLGVEAGFLPGAQAIKASFEEVKTHMLGTLAGFDAAVRAVLERTDPAYIAAQTEGQGAFLKSRTALCWAAYEKAHARLAAELDERRDGDVNRAFVAAYQRETRKSG
jgi:predicted component of type VI protein secretion system